MTDDTLALYRLFNGLPELEKQELMRAANLSDTRPSTLKGLTGNWLDGQNWVKANRQHIAPLILRWVDPSDDEVAALVSEEGLKSERRKSAGARVTFRVLFSSASLKQKNGVY